MQEIGGIQFDIENPEDLKKYFSKFPPIQKNYRRQLDKYWQSDVTLRKNGRFMAELGLISSFHLTNGFLNLPFFVLLQTGYFLQKSESIPQIHSEKVLYQFRTVCGGCMTTSRSKPHFKCCCRNNEVTSQ